MGLVTLLAVAFLGSDAPDAGPEQGAAVSRGLLQVLVVDTTAASPPLHLRHGSVDGTKIREVVTSHREALRSCYERAVLDNPALAGTSTMRIVVDRDGTVGTASVQSSSLHSMSMHRCLLQIVRTWRFPPPGDGKPAAFDYPLVFRREEPDAGS